MAGYVIGAGAMFIQMVNSRLGGMGHTARTGAGHVYVALRLPPLHPMSVPMNLTVLGDYRQATVDVWRQFCV